MTFPVLHVQLQEAEFCMLISFCCQDVIQDRCRLNAIRKALMLDLYRTVFQFFSLSEGFTALGGGYRCQLGTIRRSGGKTGRTKEKMLK